MNLSSRFLIITEDDTGELYQDNLEGEPMPKSIYDVARAIWRLSQNGVDKIKVYRMSDGADVTDQAARELAYIWPSDEPWPDVIMDSRNATQIMHEGAA